MFKNSIPVIGFSLATLLAAPALAQDNPSLEGYSGGHMQAETALQTADVASGDATHTANRQSNPGLEGYNGGGYPGGSPRYATADEPRAQVARNPDGLTDESMYGSYR